MSIFRFPRASVTRGYIGYIIYMMALGELGCTWHIEHVPEASGVQYPPHHALGFRKLVQGALTLVVGQEW